MRCFKRYFWPFHLGLPYLVSGAWLSGCLANQIPSVDTNLPLLTTTLLTAVTSVTCWWFDGRISSLISPTVATSSFHRARPSGCARTEWEPGPGSNPAPSHLPLQAALPPTCQNNTRFLSLLLISTRQQTTQQDGSHHVWPICYSRNIRIAITCFSDLQTGH